MERGGVRIERIADSKLREAVFRRRKNGLLRRAMELSVLADCDVAVLVFHGTTGQLAQYSSAPIGGLLQRFARACSKPHETYTNEDLYSHHVLAQLAADAEEAAGVGAKRARTLPSFWVTKAALERHQRGRENKRQAMARHQPGSGEDGRKDGGGGQEGEDGQAREGKRHAMPEAGREQCPQEDGEEGDGETASLSDFIDLDRHAAALAELADDAGCRLSPRSHLAYQRINREFGRLMARAREEMETAEALTAVAAEEPEGPGTQEEQQGEEQAAGTKPVRAAEACGGPQGAAAAPLPAPVAKPAAIGAVGDFDAEMHDAAEQGPALAAAASAAAGTPLGAPGSPPPPAVASPSSREAAHPSPSLTHLPQQHQMAQQGQQPTPTTPALPPVPAAAAATLAPSRPASNGGMPGAAAPTQQQQQTPTAACGIGITLPPTASSATAPPQLACALGATAQVPAAARLQLQAFPQGASYVLRPVAVPMMGAGGGAVVGRAAACAAPGQHPSQGMMLQLQPVAMQPAQMQQYQRLLLHQQQQLVAMQAAAAKAAKVAQMQAAQQQQQQQQQHHAAGVAAAAAHQVHLPQQLLHAQPALGVQQQVQQQHHDALVLPIVSLPHEQQPLLDPEHDPVADMLV